jgi:hypothetical protein
MDVNIKLILAIINEIKSSKYQSKSKFWMWPFNARYNDDTFPDPQKYLIGFYYSNKAVIYIYIYLYYFPGICL